MSASRPLYPRKRTSIHCFRLCANSGHWFAVAGSLTLGVGRPIAPMRRTHVNACLVSHQPAAKNTATWDDYHLRTMAYLAKGVAEFGGVI